MIDPQFHQSIVLIRNAINQKVIDPTFPQEKRWNIGSINRWPQLFSNLEQRWIDSLVRSPWLHEESLWVAPQTRRYKQSEQAPGSPLTQPDLNPWLVELCRFEVPTGNLGIIKSIEQYISVDQTVFTQSQYWGNPFITGIDLTWFLRLSPVTTPREPWLSISGPTVGPNQLPGIAYSDLPQTDDLWYPAASSSAANVHLPLPGGQILRVFVLVPIVEERKTVACRLTGSIQIEICRDTQVVARVTW
jgi:hypothetical protein